MADVEVAKALKTPSNLTELYTYVSYMKDKSGINGWKEQQHLLQVRFFYLPITHMFFATLQKSLPKDNFIIHHATLLNDCTLGIAWIVYFPIITYAANFSIMYASCFIELKCNLHHKYTYNFLSIL